MLVKGPLFAPDQLAIQRVSVTIALQARPESARNDWAEFVAVDAMCLAVVRVPAMEYNVAHVVLMRAQVEVGRVDAWRVVAVV